MQCIVCPNPNMRTDKKRQRLRKYEQNLFCCYSLFLFIQLLLLSVSSLTVPHSDYQSLIRLQALRQWQLPWNCETENKLHSIQPRVNVINIFRLPRRDEINIHRLRIGHTYLTLGHLLRGGTPPRCLACQVDLTVEHILLHCVSFTNARDKCFCLTLTSMSELFSKVASRSIIDFIKETGYYRKI